MRRPSNSLALAVLALLSEKPMHPYEISSTLHERRKEDSIKINYGSLYTVVESLERKGLIEARERIREGRRPERTVYALTPSGDAALQQWLGELLSEIERGSFDGMALWRRFHELKQRGREDALETLYAEFADRLTPPE